MKRLVLFMLVALLTLQVSTSFASGTTVVLHGVDENGAPIRYVVEETAHERRVSLVTEKGELGYFVYNKDDESLFSSFTNKTIPLPPSVEDPNGFSAYSVRSAGHTYTKYFSYKWIYEVSGATISVGVVMAAIIATGGLGAVFTESAGKKLAGYLAGGLAHWTGDQLNWDKHGITVTFEQYDDYVIHLGKREKVLKERIIDVGTY